MTHYGMYMVGAQSLPRYLATSVVPSRQCPRSSVSLLHVKIQLIPILPIYRIAVGTAGQYTWPFDRRHVLVGIRSKVI